MSQNYGRLIEDVYIAELYPATDLSSDQAMVRSGAPMDTGGEPTKSSRVTRTIEKAAHVTGRAIYGGYFLYNGINHLLKRKMMTEYARSKGVPAPEAAVVASGLMIIAGGASVVLGLRPKLGAGLITGFLLGVSPQMHAFWKEEEPQQRMQEMVNFTKNMALVGASLFAAAQPEPWPMRVGGM
jgi:uncharacterized membrane protein YphA (DoxX/SURF4 family)